MSQGKTLLGIPVSPVKKQDVLDAVAGFMSRKSRDYLHIVSLNPEIMMIARRDEEFRHILTAADIKIADGNGVFLALKLFKIHGCERYAGVDLMQDLIQYAGNERLRTVLIGGKPNLAVKLADCYNKEFGGTIFHGIEVTQNISNISETENNELISHISAAKPRIVLAAFGSPKQEKWIYRNRASLSGIVCMGVGGGFDFASGTVNRAPQWMRNAGMEWLYRLAVQPWRLRRQLRLIGFAALVVREKIASYVR